MSEPISGTGQLWTECFLMQSERVRITFTRKSANGPAGAIGEHDSIDPVTSCLPQLFASVVF